MDKAELKYKDFEEYLPSSVKFTEQQMQFFKDTFEQVVSNRDTSKVTCFSARCGIGKSSFIHAFMHCCIGDNDNSIRKVPQGLVFVTDSIKRLEDMADGSRKKIEDEEYWGEAFKDLGVDAYYAAFKNSVIVLKSEESLVDQLKRMHYKPIVLLSTQRYFMMTHEMREALFTFTYDKVPYKRDIVIFDEKPYFSEQIIIDIDNLTRIEAALSKGLTDEEPEKNFVMREYKNFKERLVEVMEEKERSSKKKRITLYWKDNRYPSITQNDTLFFNVIERNMESLTRKYNAIMKDLLCLREIAENGAVFYSTKKAQGEYEKYFVLVKDNRESFYLGEDKKFFVFDATSDIDPNYRKDYIDMICCEKYNIPIDMTITNVKIPTSKTTICNKRKTSIVTTDTIINHLNKELAFKSMRKEDILIVTYRTLTNRFNKAFPNVGYFGNLKGFNDYKDLEAMAHVGINRFSSLTYFFIDCSNNMDNYYKLQNMTEEESRHFFDEILDTNQTSEEYQDVIDRIIETTVSCMLVDYEQNIFRLAIRNFDNTAKCLIWTFYDNDNNTYKMLSGLIENRYKRYGVEFVYEDTPKELKAAKIKDRKPPNDSEKTHAQIILEWRDHLEVGTTYKISTLLSETGLSQAQYESARAHNKPLVEIMNGDKTNKKGYYKKNK